jgi:ParB family transcriptional regulator, chromosome partitioning protein
MANRSGLGRGLSALIPSYGPTVEMVDVDLIVPNPQQPRTRFDPDALRELTESVQIHGILQPLLVSRNQANDGTITYQLIAGERRLHAAKGAGLDKVPALIKETSNRDALELALIENIQRADLNAIEEAHAYYRLVDEYGLTQEETAVRVGKSRTAVANALRLLGLSPELQASVVTGEISEGHARALLSITDPDQRRLAWRKVVEEGLTVRQTEALTRNWTHVAATPALPKPRPTADFGVEDRLRGALGTKVQIVKGKRGGRVVIHFYNDEELESLVDRFGGSYE